MPPHDYIPDADGRFDAWQINFIAYAIEHEKRLGLSEAEVTALADAQREWTKRYEALAAARASLGGAVALKTGARGGLERVLRSVSGRLRAEPSLTDGDRAALGLNIPDTTPTPVAAPATWPLLSIDTADRLLHRVRFADSSTPARRAKPAGASGLELRMALTPAGDRPPADPGAYRFLHIATRTPTAVVFPGPDAGLTAHYTARWLSTRAHPGPWGPIASATVGA